MLSGSPNRHLKLRHAHTGEQLAITYWRYGQLNEEAESAASWFLRDWREREASPISIALLDILWAVQTELAQGGSIPTLHLTSAYRTQQTNETLARSGVVGVARDSFHLKGMAADIHCPTCGFTALATASQTLVAGGLGTYRSAGFVHVDAGPSRRWTG